MMLEDYELLMMMKYKSNKNFMVTDQTQTEAQEELNTSFSENI
jgi:hypothetical protein